MRKELQPVANEKPSVTQTGSRNIFINVQKEGIVNMNYNAPQTSVTTEMLVAIQSFSRKYYQLIVTDQNIFTSNTLIIMSNQALIEGTVPKELFSTYSTLTVEAIEALKKLPAIICNKNTDYNGNTNPGQFAIYAYVKDIKKCGKEIIFSFSPIFPFKQHYLNENAANFHINIDCALTDLNKSRWSIKKVNLFEAFKKSNINVPEPLT